MPSLYNLPMKLQWLFVEFSFKIFLCDMLKDTRKIKIREIKKAEYGELENFFVRGNFCSRRNFTAAA